MAEEWRHVQGWPYEVSSLGRVRRTEAGKGARAGKILKGIRGSQDGYLCVSLCRDGRPWRIRVAPLVCEVFHGEKPTSTHQTAHNNGVHDDNRADNLRWATPQENTDDVAKHGRLLYGSRLPQSVLTESQVTDIRARILRGDRQVAIAALFGVSPSTVSQIKHRHRWRRAE